MKKQLRKPGLACDVKRNIGLGRVELASTKNECTDSGSKFASQECKGSKCCNGAGGC